MLLVDRLRGVSASNFTEFQLLARSLLDFELDFPVLRIAVGLLGGVLMSLVLVHDLLD